MVWSSVVNLTFIAITAGLIFRKPWKLENFLFIGEKFGIWKHLINTNLKVLSQFKDVNEILKFAEVPSINHPIGEGLVFKSNTLVNGDTLSFKAISNKFLLKSEN